MIKHLRAVEAARRATDVKLAITSGTALEDATPAQNIWKFAAGRADGPRGLWLGQDASALPASKPGRSWLRGLVGPRGPGAGGGVRLAIAAGLGAATGAALVQAQSAQAGGVDYETPNAECYINGCPSRGGFPSWRYR